jgi:hypothetical protein
MSDLAFADTVRMTANEHGAVQLTTRNGQMYGLTPTAAILLRRTARRRRPRDRGARHGRGVRRRTRSANRPTVHTCCSCASDHPDPWKMDP